ncbi:MAG: NAD(+) synthase [Treponema sp.]|nr:NAD(+) synthase [Treponema sp.]
MSIKSEAIAWVKEYFAKNGNENTKAVIGISGGKDSATVAALCCAALGKDRVIGVMMPNGVQADIEDSKEICKFLGIKNYTINIQDAYRGLTGELKKAVGVKETPAQYNTNTPARLRMATLYSIAALEGNCRVSNNGNKSECTVGYFTLWGDGAGDFAPLANLYVNEVIKLGLALGLPEEFVKKAPSDGMSGMTDEDKLGFTYADLEKVARGKTEKMKPEVVKKIKAQIKAMSFKKKLLNIPNFKPSTAK